MIELAPPGEVTPLTSFLAGLIYWTGSTRPTEHEIAGHKCVYQTVIHIKAITHRGEKIVGCRSLESDGIEPHLMIDGADVRRGYRRVRQFDPAKDRSLPRFSYSGYDVIDLKAALFFEGKP